MTEYGAVESSEDDTLDLTGSSQLNPSSMDVDENDSNIGSTCIDEEALLRGITNVLQNTTKWVKKYLSLSYFFSLERLHCLNAWETFQRTNSIVHWSSIIPQDDYLWRSIDIVPEQAISMVIKIWFLNFVFWKSPQHILFSPQKMEIVRIVWIQQQWHQDTAHKVSKRYNYWCSCLNYCIF